MYMKKVTGNSEILIRKQPGRNGKKNQNRWKSPIKSPKDNYVVKKSIVICLQKCKNLIEWSEYSNISAHWVVVSFFNCMNEVLNSHFNVLTVPCYGILLCFHAHGCFLYKAVRCTYVWRCFTYVRTYAKFMVCAVWK